MSYQPVSNISKPSLAFGRIIFASLFSFVSNKIYSFQFEFHWKCSTLLQIPVFGDYLFQNNDEDIPFYCLYLDFSKTLDCVPLYVLIRKLFTISIGGNRLQLFFTYSSDRLLCAKFDCFLSRLKSVTVGGHQKPVIGPLHFIISINDREE